MKEKYLFSQASTHETSLRELPVPSLQILVKRADFASLDSFRHQIALKGQILNKEPYSKVKIQSAVYRTIFLNLGFLYLILSGTLFWKGTFFSPLSFLQNSFKVHPLIPLFCFLSALCCLYGGIAISSVKEAVRKIHGKAKRSLKKACHKHHWAEGAERLSHAKQKAMQLVCKISASTELDMEQKERLYNELLLELDQEMQAIVQDRPVFECSALKAI